MPPLNFDERQLQKKFEKHASDFGIMDNYNSQTQLKYKQVLMAHVANLHPQVIVGTWHKLPVFHYFNPITKNNVMFDLKGNFISGWRLNPLQEYNLLFSGSL